MPSDAVNNMWKKINKLGLSSAITDLSTNLNPDVVSILTSSSIDELSLDNEEVIRVIHHILFDFHVIRGFLICPESGRKFPIKDGIPNMLLHEDEL